MAVSPEDTLMQTLTSGRLFSSHPLPENDPFTPLLARYLPVQARPQRKNAQAGPDESTASLIGSGRWHALADRMGNEIQSRKGRHNNTTQDVQAVLTQWSIRLQCLRRLHHLHMLASEASALFSELPPLYTMPEYPTPHPDSPFFESFVPFKLVLLWAVLPIYLRGDQHLVLQHLQEISYGCKLEYRRSGDTIWISRLRCTAIAIANVLYSMGELQQSLALLQMLSKHEEGSQLLPAVCMLALEMGDIASAEAAVTHMKETEGLATQAQALEIAKLLCEGQWAAAEEAARNNAEISETSARSKVNLAVCCLYTAKTQEGIEILESIARTDPSFFYNSESNLSNLISLQELQAGDQIANKLDLLKECSRYSSEALSLDCLRL